MDNVISLSVVIPVYNEEQNKQNAEEYRNDLKESSDYIVFHNNQFLSKIFSQCYAKYIGKC